MTRRLAALAAVFAFAPALPARQPPRPEGTEAVLTGPVGPDGLRLVNDWLRERQLRQTNPELLNALKKFAQANPGLDTGAAVAKFLEQNPTLAPNVPPDTLKQLVDAQLKGRGPDGGTPEERQSVPPRPPDRLPGGERPALPLPRGQGADLPVPQPPALDRSDAANAFLQGELPRNLPTPRGAQPGAGTDQAVDARRLQQAAAAWEKYLGPLKDTPAVREALAEFLKSADGRPSPFSELLKTVGPIDPPDGKSGLLSGLNLDRLFPKGFGSGGAPGLPDLGPPGDASGAGLAVGSFAGVLAAAAGLCGLLWLLRGKLPALGRRARAARPRDAWPLDPRLIRDRQALVTAFEHLSLAEAGPDARHWAHSKIGDELAARHPESAADAVELGRLYAVARYAPDGFPAESVSRGRDAICRIAGVPT